MTTFIRKCPNCDCEITYLNKYSMSNAEKKQSKCKSCAIKNSITDDVRKKMSERLRGENNPMYGKIGNLNPFFGKHHTKETKEKILKNRDYSVYKTNEFREKISKITSGRNNPMFGKSVYDQWLKKYGKTIADDKMNQYKLKQSFNNKGKKNSMYGKPSPKNSGNGICGWYKGWFFRSLLELSYMIFVIERFNLMWETGESEKYKINYIQDGVNKNYFPDFVINGKYIIECKPKKLWLNSKNLSKFNFAEKFCKENNYIFKVRDLPKIKKIELMSLIDSGLVILTNKWKDKIHF
jgi:hypothetical protein